MVRLNLQSWLPKELHGEINHLLVGFGQVGCPNRLSFLLSAEIRHSSDVLLKVLCLPIGPRCDVCDLNTKDLCPSAQKVVNAKNRKTIVFSTPEKDAYPKLEVKLEEEEEIEPGGDPN